MKRPRINPKGINEITDNITRQSSEPEDINLAAEASESAPAKSLKRVRPAGAQSPRRGRTKQR